MLALLIIVATMSRARSAFDTRTDTQFGVPGDWDDMGDLMIGTVTYSFPEELKREYDVVDSLFLGSGGQAAVWKVVTGQQETLAIKLFHDSKKLLTVKIMNDLKRVKMVQSELVKAVETSVTTCRLVREILHNATTDAEGAQHICQCHQAIIPSDDASYPHVVQEFCGDQTVMSQRSATGMDVGLARKYMIQLLSALKFLANLNPPIIHHDVKPENMAVADGVMKLVDFESAMTWEQRGVITAQTFPTPANAPPEAQEPDALLSMSLVPYGYDAFSAGVTYWQMLCPPEADKFLPHGYKFQGMADADNPAFKLMSCDAKRGRPMDLTNPGRVLDRVVIQMLTKPSPNERLAPNAALLELDRLTIMELSNMADEANAVVTGTLH